MHCSFSVGPPDWRLSLSLPHPSEAAKKKKEQRLLLPVLLLLPQQLLSTEASFFQYVIYGMKLLACLPQAVTTCVRTPRLKYYPIAFQNGLRLRANSFKQKKRGGEFAGSSFLRSLCSFFLQPREKNINLTSFSDSNLGCFLLFFCSFKCTFRGSQGRRRRLPSLHSLSLLFGALIKHG